VRDPDVHEQVAVAEVTSATMSTWSPRADIAEHRLEGGKRRREQLVDVPVKRGMWMPNEALKMLSVNKRQHHQPGTMKLP
jgi:hypothetical protein